MGLKRRAPARRAEQQPLRPSVRPSVHRLPWVRACFSPSPACQNFPLCPEVRARCRQSCGKPQRDWRVKDELLRPAPGSSVVGDGEKRRWGRSGRRVVPASCPVPAPGDLCSVGCLRVFPWRPVKARFGRTLRVVSECRLGCCSGGCRSAGNKSKGR